jgi:hypothetical protein
MSTTKQVPGFADATAAATCESIGRISFHLFWLRITIASLRPIKFCWSGRLVSVVSSTSNPACSAAKQFAIQKRAPSLLPCGLHRVSQ